MSKNGFCSSCGKIVENRTLSYCAACYEKERSDYEKVRAYIRDHPHCNAIDVAQETGVDISTIMKYIKERTLLLK